MITAVDTSVLLDVFTADKRFGAASHAALTGQLREGSLICCEAVWAELAAGFPTEELLTRNMDRLGVRLVPLDVAAASAAGHAWRKYRRAGGTRKRIMTDFLIGGHAIIHADLLLTRERGFYRRHFEGLAIAAPRGS